jgi:hypothetical protein
MHCVGIPVEHKVSLLEDRPVTDRGNRLARTAAGPANPRRNTGEKDVQIKRLGYVIVCAEPESLEHHIALVPGSKHYQRKVRLAPQYLSTRGHPVKAGKHEVHQDEVDSLTQGGLKSRAAVVLLDHLVSGSAKVVRQQVGDGRVVFDQEDPKSLALQVVPRFTLLTRV